MAFGGTIGGAYIACYNPPPARIKPLAAALLQGRREKLRPAVARSRSGPVSSWPPCIPSSSRPRPGCAGCFAGHALRPACRRRWIFPRIFSQKFFPEKIPRRTARPPASSAPASAGLPVWPHSAAGSADSIRRRSAGLPVRFLSRRRIRRRSPSARPRLEIFRPFRRGEGFYAHGLVILPGLYYAPYSPPSSPVSWLEIPGTKKSPGKAHTLPGLSRSAFVLLCYISPPYSPPKPSNCTKNGPEICAKKVPRSPLKGDRGKGFRGVDGWKIARYHSSQARRPRPDGPANRRKASRRGR